MTLSVFGEHTVPRACLMLIAYERETGAVSAVLAGEMTKMEINKKYSFIFTIFALVAVVSSGARAWDFMTRDDFSLYYVGRDAVTSLDNFVTENEPPMVREVVVLPDNPSVGDDITIEASIVNNPLLTRSRPVDAQLFYSVDNGETWTSASMSRDDARDDVWLAEIESPAEPGRVLYFFQVEDDSGNMLLETPETYVAWNGDTAAYLPSVVRDADDDDRLVTGEQDIRAAYAGYDGRDLYFGIELELTPTSGTLSPFLANIYSVGIFYPDRLNNNSIKSDLILEYAPLAKVFGLPDIGLLDIRRDLHLIRNSGVETKIQGNRLFMRFNKDVLETGEFDKLRIIFGTAHVVNMSIGLRPQTVETILSLSLELNDVVATPLDSTMFINLVRSDRYFDVSAETTALTPAAIEK